MLDTSKPLTPETPLTHDEFIGLLTEDIDREVRFQLSPGGPFVTMGDAVDTVLKDGLTTGKERQRARQIMRKIEDSGGDKVAFVKNMTRLLA